MSPPFAFLAQGKVHVRDDAGSVRVFTSAFGEAVRERAIAMHKGNAWKNQGRGADFMSRNLLWGAPVRDPETVLVSATNLSRGPAAGELYYSMDVDGRTAICALRTEDGAERRLIHGSERRIADLSGAPGREHIACSAFHKDMTASIALMSADATDIVEVTAGESQDAAPSWVMGDGRRIVYHSAGIGRDAAGRPTGLGPSEINTLDVDRAETETIASDRSADLMAPRMLADGTLFYIQRPWRHGYEGGFWRAFADFLLFPARLLFAVFQFLNFFTTRYTGKPLTTASGPRREGADLRQMMVWSNLMQAREAAADGDQPAPEVPAAWKLVRRAPGGATTNLAEGVLCFDVARDGSILYSTGSAIYLIEPSGARQKVAQHPGVRQVVLLR
jgi:hypothetical protein